MSFPFSLKNRNASPKTHHKSFPNISKVVGICSKDGKNQEHLGWYHLVLLHFARKEDAGPPAPASYGAGIVVGALRVAVQLPTELPKVEHWGRVAWVYGVARKERILNNR